MNQRLLFLLIALMTTLRVWAGNPLPLHGDVTHDGRITEQDVTLLAQMVLLRQSAQEWYLQNGEVRYRSLAATPGTHPELCGDMDHNGQLTIADVVLLAAQTQDATKAEYVVVKDGKITYGCAGGIGFDPEDDGFIDDGEIDF